MSEPTAAQLKDEGNELFRKQDYVGAFAKYTEAIALDDKNAVLYANRAACNYGLGRYLDAVADAKMAIKVDPGYAKGWSRLAASRDALADWERSTEAWQKALDVLPKTNLSLAEQRQKDQCTAGLSAAQARGNADREPIFPRFKASDGKLPWQVATEMLPELRRAGPKKFSSSAWVIAYAYEEFTRGVELMNEVKKMPHPQASGGFAYAGNLMALTYLTNGLMRDERAFHINQPDWITKYNQQFLLEAMYRQAWDSVGLEIAKEGAQTRLKEKGWDDVRPALSVTVRAWIMRGVLDKLRGEPQAGIQFLKQAVDLLEWGRNIWKNVTNTDRGPIFEDTFVRGVRSMHLKMFRDAYNTDPGLNSKYPLEHLKEEAEDLLKEIEIGSSQNPRKEQVDPGAVSSFYIYPAGIAHSMIGFYHVQTALYDNDPLTCMFSFMRGAQAYMKAAGKYPEDDELHAWNLSCAMDCMRNAGISKICDLDAVAISLRKAIPKMKKIWALSALQHGGRDRKIRVNLDIADNIMKHVEEGKLTLEDPVPLWS
ncbi:hypothetical protein EDB19DRAFT_1858604 [Suillus lakei]|nr:hypothetical protein EDB19DRAFT_1858604 [Suillus lakei]